MSTSPNTRRQPSKEIVLFLDRNWGRKIVADWLKRVGQRVEVHHEYFDQDSPDHIWIPKCAERGWVILSPDKRIERDLPNKVAVVNSQARVFLFSSHGFCGEELASLVMVSRKRIIDIATHKQGPFYVRIGKHADFSKPKFFSPKEKAEILASVRK